MTLVPYMGDILYSAVILGETVPLIRGVKISIPDSNDLLPTQ